MTPYQEKTFYVYSHIDPRDGTRRYVGIGQYDRAWSARSTHRNKGHYDWITELYDAGYTLADIVKIEHKNLTKKEALELESNVIKTEKPKFNELGNPDHWNRGRKYDSGLALFAKTLHDMGYGYIRIAQLMGGEKNNHMTAKRMIQNAK